MNNRDPLGFLVPALVGLFAIIMSIWIAATIFAPRHQPSIIQQER